MTDDIRRQQRFHNYTKALQTLTEAVELAQQRPLSKLEKQGTIQGFEFTHELGWNVLKDFLEGKGYTGLIGSRDATRTAFKNGLMACASTSSGWAGAVCAWVGADYLKPRAPDPL